MSWTVSESSTKEFRDYSSDSEINDLFESGLNLSPNSVRNLDNCYRTKFNNLVYKLEHYPASRPQVSKCALCREKPAEDEELIQAYCEVCQFSQAICKYCHGTYIHPCKACNKMVCPNHRWRKANCVCEFCEQCNPKHLNGVWNCEGCGDNFCNYAYRFKCEHEHSWCLHCHHKLRERFQDVQVCQQCGESHVCCQAPEQLSSMYGWGLGKCYCKEYPLLCCDCRKNPRLEFIKNTDYRRCQLCPFLMCLKHVAAASRKPCDLCQQYYCPSHNSLKVVGENKASLCLACRVKLNRLASAMCRWIYRPNSSYVQSVVLKEHEYFEQHLKKMIH